jgi:hypothetical protein
MKKLREYLPALFRSNAVQETPVFKSSREVASGNDNDIAVFDFQDWEEAARLYNTLIFNVPPQAMADMAFDDYYPAFFFALKRFENGRNAGVGEENKQRVDFSNFKNLPARQDTSGQYSVIEEFYELQEKLKDSIKVDVETGKGQVDRKAFMQAVYDHLDILVAMHRALHIPIKNVPEIKSTALANEESPLRDDIVTSRYGSAYSGEYLDELFSFIEWAADNAPNSPQSTISHDVSQGVISIYDPD